MKGKDKKPDIIHLRRKIDGAVLKVERKPKSESEDTDRDNNPESSDL